MVSSTFRVRRTGIAHRALASAHRRLMFAGTSALASGLASAYLLETPRERAHVGASSASNAQRTHHAHAGDALVGDADAIAVDHNDDACALKEWCLKACDDGSNAQFKLKTTADFTGSRLELFVSFAWNATTPVAATPSRFNNRQAPVVIAPL